MNANAENKNYESAKRQSKGSAMKLRYKNDNKLKNR
jgi:hypothetical protein